MFLYKNTDVTKISRVEGIASNTSFLVVLLMLCLFFPLLGNADGLFDFQMKLAKGGSAEAQYKVGERLWCKGRSDRSDELDNKISESRT
jgi:hypothetical protein